MRALFMRGAFTAADAVAAGRTIYELSCQRCHEAAAQGKDQLRIPRLAAGKSRACKRLMRKSTSCARAFTGSCKLAIG